jgi:hypothetical protein
VLRRPACSGRLVVWKAIAGISGCVLFMLLLLPVVALLAMIVPFVVA